MTWEQDATGAVGRQGDAVRKVLEHLGPTADGREEEVEQFVVTNMAAIAELKECTTTGQFSAQARKTAVRRLDRQLSRLAKTLKAIEFALKDPALPRTLKVTFPLDPIAERGIAAWRARCIGAGTINVPLQSSKRFAADAAALLLDRFNISLVVSKESTFCVVASILHGGGSCYHHCLDVMNERKSAPGSK